MLVAVVPVAGVVLVAGRVDQEQRRADRRSQIQRDIRPTRWFAAGLHARSWRRARLLYIHRPKAARRRRAHRSTCCRSGRATTRTASFCRRPRTQILSHSHGFPISLVVCQRHWPQTTRPVHAEASQRVPTYCWWQVAATCHELNAKTHLRRLIAPVVCSLPSRARRFGCPGQGLLRYQHGSFAIAVLDLGVAAVRWRWHPLWNTPPG